MHRFTILLAVVATSMLSMAYAEQTRVPNFSTTRDQYFYGLYETTSARDATDIYCGIRFSVEQRSNGRGFKGPGWLNIEHAYPAQWMADSLNCGNRKTCPNDPRIGKLFSHAEADMHNLWPASSSLNSSRGKKPFGEINEEMKHEITIGQKTFSCDFKNNGKLVEPRAIVRGNLARSIFYMCDEYGFRVPKEMMPILQKWNREDPPTRVERARAKFIEKIQGTPNKFIDKPSLGDTVQCKTM